MKNFNKLSEKRQREIMIANGFNPDTEKAVCCLCNKDYSDYGNSALPIYEGFCCDKCNTKKVTPARIKEGLNIEEVKKFIDYEI